MQLISIPVKEKIAHIVGSYFTTNEIMNVFTGVNIRVDKELFAKWKITLDALNNLSNSDNSDIVIMHILETFCHPLKFSDPQVRHSFIEELNSALAYDALKIKWDDRGAKLEIPTDFKDWAVARLKQMNKKEIIDREQTYGNQRREYEACVRRVDNLIDMRANGEITEDKFKTKKTAILLEKDRLQEFLKDTDKRVENWLEITERGFNYAEKAASIFCRSEEE
jgi:hypothetical protein